MLLHGFCQPHHQSAIGANGSRARNCRAPCCQELYALNECATDGAPVYRLHCTEVCYLGQFQVSFSILYYVAICCSSRCCMATQRRSRLARCVAIVTQPNLTFTRVQHVFSLSYYVTTPRGRHCVVIAASMPFRPQHCTNASINNGQ